MYLGLAAALAAWYNVIRHYTGPERFLEKRTARFAAL